MKNTHTIDSTDSLSVGSLIISRYGCRKKVIDEYLDPDEVYYSDIPDIKHTADCLERAIEIGQEYLNNKDACC